MGLSFKNQSGERYYKIQFVNKKGKPDTIYLGYDEKEANYHLPFIETLIELSKSSNPIYRDNIIEYLQEIKKENPNLYKKLEKKGLTVKTEEETKEDRYDNQITVRQLCDIWESKYKDGNENTYKNVKLAADKLRDYFKDKKYIDISDDDIEGLLAWMKRNQLQPPTIKRLLKRYKQVAKFGLEKGLIEGSNKFAIKYTAKQSNPERVKTISKDLFQQVISVCTNDELRFALFLGRFASFRLFSEAYKWRWSFIDFKSEKFIIQRKDVNGEQRFTTMPMIDYFYPFFDEILTYYECKSYIKDSKDLNEEQKGELLKQKGNRYVAEMVKRYPKNEDFVFTEQFRSRTNRRSQILKLLKKAKVEDGDWLKVTHNLRSSCSKDFNKMFGPEIAAKLCGHGMDIAYEHYLDSQEEEFIKSVINGKNTKENDIKIIKDMIVKYGLKEFESMVQSIISK